MAPASAVAFSLGAAIPFAGGALPLAVLIALIVCSLIALNIGSLARYLPSAGGFFTYVSRGLGSQAGWMTGWLFSLTYLLIVPLQLLVLGPVMDGFAQQYFHLSFGANGWAVWSMVFAVIIFGLTYFGIRISANASVILGTIEIAVFVVLAAWLIVTAGNGNTAATFSPSSSLEKGLGGWQGILHGMIFAFLAFAGFESSAPLAEEAHNPRRTVPRAILLAAVSIGVFYVFCSYAGVNAASRVLYAMGRTRTLPGPLAHISSRFRTPDTAIIFTMIVGVIFTLWPGFVYGAGTAFALLGTIITILILVVYMAACLAVPFFYRRERPQEFNALRHVLLPAIPFVVLIFPILAQFIPAPSPPLNLAAPICAAWFVLGLVIVILLSLRAPRALAQSNKVYLEDEPVLEEERSAG